MLKKILLGLVVILAIVAIVVMMQPADFRITRSIKINAPAEVVYDQINDLHKWQTWSPWAKLDPAAKNTFKGPPSGKDAKFSWSGNDQIGEGTMLIVETKPAELVRIKLDFVKPHAATAMTDFAFKQTGDETEATWSMYSQRGFMEKAIGLFLDMEKLIGPDFERGLADMKKQAEAAAKN